MNKEQIVGFESIVLEDLFNHVKGYDYESGEASPHWDADTHYDALNTFLSDLIYTARDYKKQLEMRNPRFPKLTEADYWMDVEL